MFACTTTQMTLCRALWGHSTHRGQAGGPPDRTFRHFILIDLLKQKKTSEVPGTNSLPPGNLFLDSCQDPSLSENSTISLALCPRDPLQIGCPLNISTLSPFCCSSTSGEKRLPVLRVHLACLSVTRRDVAQAPTAPKSQRRFPSCD